MERATSRSGSLHPAQRNGEEPVGNGQVRRELDTAGWRDMYAVARSGSDALEQGASGCHGEFGVSSEEGCCLRIVLLIEHRAGDVQQRSTGLHVAGAVSEDCRLFYDTRRDLFG